MTKSYLHVILGLALLYLSVSLTLFIEECFEDVFVLPSIFILQKH